MIVDFHTHLFPPLFRTRRDLFFAGEPGFELLYSDPDSRLAGWEELIQNMDEDEVQCSVVFGFPWEEEEHFRRHNDYILETMARHPGRLVGFCAFSPHSPHALKEAERCLEEGLRGVGELALYHKGAQGPASMVPEDLLEICLRFNAPLLLHTNEPVGHSYPGKIPLSLGALYELVREHPANRFILAHWGGGLPFYGLMKKEVKEVFRQVWFDTAASPYLYRPDIYRVAGEIVGFDRILFGSDYPLLRPGRYFKEMESAALPPEAVRMIRGDNAARLLGLHT